MSKSNFFVKYLKNINISINSLLEKNLNKLNLKNFRYIIKNNKIILTFVAVLILFLSYLSLPTFYNQNEISTELKKKLLNKFNLEFIFIEGLKYNLFPTPHFTSKKSIIKYENDKISEIKNLKIEISLENFFSLNNIEIKDLIIKNANFNLNKKNYQFFLNLMKKKFEGNNLKIKNSNIFFRNIDKEVMFINKISNMRYFFDEKEKKNKIISKNVIFNLPYEIEFSQNINEKKTLTKINLKHPKISIENELDYNQDTKTGKALVIINKSQNFLDYKLDKTVFEFKYFNKLDKEKFLFEGLFNLKPFYSLLNGKTRELNVTNLFDINSFIIQVLKTEILNNKNIDFKININADNIYPYINFTKLNFISKIEEGLIDFDGSEINFKNFAQIKLTDSLILIKNGELFLDGKLQILIQDYYEIYKYLLTPKNFRNKLNKIDLNFSYNFDQKTINLSDIKIDNKFNYKISEILKNIVFKENKLQNKIYLKNLLNEAIKSYSG
tara:strand:+ start:490 stop:1980 length:1491 start_codon:yes stop_codon:yes gene_type:complete